jgi:hypothetical protein
MGTMIETASKYEIITRQNGSNSRQPRFNEVSPNKFFTSLFRFINTDIHNEPAYGTQHRDQWLRDVWKLEPYLAGVINSVVSIDKNRGWTITGGRNQVRRFSKLLHERFYYAPDLSGWRLSFGGSALSYYTADIGNITEIGRDGRGGPMLNLYFTDPSRCTLTGDFDFPLKYNPTQGSEQLWNREDYFRVVSMPDTDESKYGLGFCALSRCIELAKIMIGIYQYDNEMLLNRAPRGLLLLKGITQDQWEEAMAARDTKLDGDEKRYYGAVNVIAQNDPGVELEAQLTALSNLPAEFNQQVFTDLLMFGYALVFGYDPREFWPVTGGQLGTATETETQHRKAGGKGGLDFTLGFAEKIQEEWPDTIQFEFDERDLDGELADAEVEQAQADIAISLYDKGTGLISRDEGRIKLAEKGVIDPEWTENEEETVATDVENVETKSESTPSPDENDTQNEALQNERVQRAIWQYPNEPIVQYRFKVKNGKGKHEYRTLLNPSRVSRRFYSFGRMVKRQATIDAELASYQEQLNSLGQQANDGEIPQDEFEARLEALTIAILTLSLIRGTEGTSDAERALEDAALLILEDDSLEAMTAGLAVLTDETLLNDALSQEALSALIEDIDGSLQSTLAADIYAEAYVDNAQGLLSRLQMWGLTATGLYSLGQLLGHPDQLYQWRLGATLEHCNDCSRLNGQVHTGSEWAASGYRPQGRNLECTGRRCECGVFPVNLPTSGSF